MDSDYVTYLAARSLMQVERSVDSATQPLAAFIAKLQAAADGLDGAEVEIEGYDYSMAKVTVKGTREPTEEELVRERNRQLAAQGERERKERETYEKLRAKFDPTETPIAAPLEP